MAHEELKKYVFRTASFYVAVRICEGIYVETGILFTKTSQNLDEIKLENHWTPKIRCIQFYDNNNIRGQLNGNGWTTNHQYQGFGTLLVNTVFQLLRKLIPAHNHKNYRLTGEARDSGDRNLKTYQEKQQMYKVRKKFWERFGITFSSEDIAADGARSGCFSGNETLEHFQYIKSGTIKNTRISRFIPLSLFKEIKKLDRPVITYACLEASQAMIDIQWKNGDIIKQGKAYFNAQPQYYLENSERGEILINHGQWIVFSEGNIKKTMHRPDFLQQYQAQGSSEIIFSRKLKTALSNLHVDVKSGHGRARLLALIDKGYFSQEEINMLVRYLRATQDDQFIIVAVKTCRHGTRTASYWYEQAGIHREENISYLGNCLASIILTRYNKSKLRQYNWDKIRSLIKIKAIGLRSRVTKILLYK